MKSFFTPHPMAAAVPAAATVLVLGASGSGKTTLINLLARKVIRAPNSDYVRCAVPDLEVKDCIVPYLGHPSHFYVRFLECPGLSGGTNDDAAALAVCSTTFAAVSPLCASVLVAVPFSDQLYPSLDTFLHRLFHFIKQCAGKKVTFVITKVDTVAQYHKATTVIGPSILAWLQTQSDRIPFLADFLVIGTGSIDIQSLRPRIEKSLFELGSSLQVVPPPPPPAPRKHVRAEPADPTDEPPRAAKRVAHPAPPPDQMDTK